jgi:osmotically-inducible protein OsmY
VTLTGIVGSKTEHDRAMMLARETDGVTEVIDNMKMLQPVG